MGTLGTRGRKGKKPAARRANGQKRAHPAIAKLAAALREHEETLEQQAATAEILRVISSSPSDMQPVFDSILEHAMRLCDAGLGTVGLYDGTTYRHRAQRGGSAEYVKRLLAEPFVPHPDGTIGRMITERAPVHIPDYRELPAYRAREPRAVATVELGGARTYLAVPMLKHGQVLGGITIRRAEVRPFTQKQIDLVSTFANQAVIAIENARLFNETKEALERQTATSEILHVISSSPTDLEPVFAAISRRFTSLCGAAFSSVYTFDGQLVHYAGGAGFTPERERTHRGKYPVPVDDPSVVSARTILTKAVVHVQDTLSDPHYDSNRAAALSVRRLLGVPMLRDGVPLGALVAGWSEPGATPKNHEEVLRTFADQAVIAIENVRLFNETKEALEQQTATAEILKVISASPTDVRPVLQAIVERAAQLVPPCDVGLNMLEGSDLYQRAAAGPQVTTVNRTQLQELFPVPLDPEASLLARSVVRCEVVEVADTEASGLPPRVAAAGRIANYRSLTFIPLVREQNGIGALGIAHPEAGFKLSEKQLAVLKTFADQAVIAIENVRLFNETKEALDRQTATSEVLRVISSTPADAQPVFDAIAQSAARVFNAPHTGVALVEGESIRLRATAGQVDPRGRTLIPFNETSTAGSALLKRAIIDIADIEADEAPPFARESGRAVGFRAIASAPMLRDGKGIGVITVMRAQPGALTEKERQLLQTFADQAVIAIENARLFNETKEALERQTATSHILSVISRSPSDLQPVFDAILERATRLCSAHL